MIHKSFNEWTAKVIVKWERHCVKQRVPLQLGVDMYAIFQLSVVVESLNLEKKYSKSLLGEDSLLSNDLLE